MIQELRYALRALKNNPSFAAIAVLTLALGIGANTAMSSVVNGVLLRPLEYPNAARIVQLNTSQRGRSFPRLTGPDVVDVRSDAEGSPDYQLTAEKIRQWEAAHGRIPSGAIVLLRTGWASRWLDVKRYRNQDEKGVMHFPGYSVEAARILLERNVNGLGCDTLSIDPGNSADFPVHRLVLGSEKYQLENLTNLDKLPETGAFLIVAPIKLEGGSGGPVRVFALLP